MICVVVRAADPARVAEALRAAVGLGLRGDPVEVLLDAPARAVVDAASNPEVGRATATLRALGHRLDDAGPGQVAAAIRVAAAVEVWT